MITKQHHAGSSSICIICLVSLILLGAFTIPANANADENQRSVLSGPGTVVNRIEADRGERQLSEFGFLKGWYDLKDRISEENGFAIGFDYIMVGSKSTESLPDTDDYAAGGIVRVFGSWTLTGRGTSSTGSIVYQLENHHSYTGISPQDWAPNNLGYVGLTNTQFDDREGMIANLYWRQNWNKGQTVLLAGYQDVAGFFDVYALADPYKHFQNLSFLTGGGTVSIPSAGTLGGAVGTWVSDFVYIQGGIADANVDTDNPLDGFDTFFNDNEYFTHFEIGLTTSGEMVYLDNVHLSLWHVDKREEAHTEDGWGAVISASKWFKGGYLPFFKAGYSGDGSSLRSKSVSVGLGYQPNPIGDDAGNLLGIGLNWSEANEVLYGSGLDEQYTLESFYRWQVSRELAITTNIQYLKDPATNPDDSSVWIFGIRLRAAI